MKKISSNAFTLIELLVVISIIGVLATVGLNTFPGAIAKARDSQRVDDARKIVAAVQQFYTEKGRYPGNADSTWRNSTGVQPWILDSDSSWPTNYLPSVPVDPINTYQVGVQDRAYWYRTDGQDYCIQVPQERDSSSSRNFKIQADQAWKLRFGPYGPNGGLCN